MSCPTDKDYYIAIFALIAFLNICQLVTTCAILPFFCLRTNIKAFTYSVYGALLTIFLMSLPFIPEDVQHIFAVAVVVIFLFPLRLPTNFIAFMLRWLITPVQSTRSSSPRKLLLFTSLLNYYKLQLQEIDLPDGKDELGPLLLTLVGCMSNHCLPGSHVSPFSYASSRKWSRLTRTS